MGHLAGLGAATAGLLFGLSLIVAIGPQNTFVLRQGVRSEYVALVVGLCAASDVVMIAAGVGGAGAVLAGRAWLTTAVGVAGAAFLLGYAGSAARRAARPAGAVLEAGQRAASTRGVVLACLAFTWLNPGVYVDTMFLVGPVSQAHGGERWAFGAGAMIASVGWFVALGFGARMLGPLFTRPAAWRLVDAAVALVMTLTAARLLLSL